MSVKQPKLFWYIALALIVAGTVMWNKSFAADPTVAAYVCPGRTDEGSFYDCGGGFVFKTQPLNTDYVDTQTTTPGPAAPGLHPGKFVRFDSLTDDKMIGICNLTGGVCTNQNGGVEGYIGKSFFTGGVTTPPDPTPPGIPHPMPCGFNCFEITWTSCLFNTDGSTCHPTNYRLSYQGPQSGMLLTGLVNGYLQTGLAPGTYHMQMTTLDATGESDPTNSATVEVTEDVAPLVLSVSDTKVYKQTLKINGFVMNEIGTIALKTPCVAAHVVDGFNLLPDRTKVTYTCGAAKTPCPPNKIVMPTSAYAKCALQ